jgi:hypothetical protein
MGKTELSDMLRVRSRLLKRMLFIGTILQRPIEKKITK